MTFQYFFFLHLWKLLEVLGKIGKCWKVLKTIFQQFLKTLEIFRNLWQTSETHGKFSNTSEVYEIFL